MSEPVIQSIPLSQLELSPANVRKTSAGKTAFAELKASIAAHGLLENLIVRVTDGSDRYAVIAGGRRLTALIDLAREGMLSIDYLVPCRVVDDTAPESELSLTENVVRAAMHPADQVEAFAGLADGGATVADIAVRFGVAERLVEQRLRLGNAAPVLLDAYREGDIDLEVLTAFAVTADRERQIAVWEQVKEQGYRPGAWQIKRMLTEDRVAARTAIARFVGIEAYEAAGGAVTRDLFADEDDNGVWLDDPELLNKLATAKLESAANDLRPEWKWAEARIDMDWNAIARFGRIVSTPATPTEEERAELERLEAREDELTNLDDAEWTEALVEEADAIEARNDELKASLEARAEFLDADRAISGCIATIREDGELRLIKGLVRPEDMPQRKSAVDGTEADDGEGEYGALDAPGISGPAASPVDPRAEARKEAGVGIGLADDLRAIRTTLVKAHLARDFEAAFDLLLFQMGRAVFTGGYQAGALDITIRETPDRPMLRMNDDTFQQLSPGEALLADRSGLAFDWMEKQDDEDAFTVLRALPEADKQALFAACVARTLKGQLAFEHGARPEFEATVARLGIVFATQVRPTAELFWSRITKGRMLGVARATLGAAWAQARAKLKKTELSTVMEEAFAGEDAAAAGVPAEAREPARFWVMPGFQAYDNRGLDDNDGNGGGDSDVAENGKADGDTVEAAPKAEPESDVVGDNEPDALDETEPPVDPVDSPEAAEDNGATDPETPQRTMNACVHAIVESIDSPAVAESRTAALGALNAVPTSDGGPRVIVNTSGLGGDASVDDGSGDPTPEDAPPTPPVRGNGHDSAAANLLEIPAFLRRS